MKTIEIIPCAPKSTNAVMDRYVIGTMNVANVISNYERTEWTALDARDLSTPMVTGTEAEARAAAQNLAERIAAV